jgi:EAL domain-containing protein (putative c-di-GMP-specific phosphodiesterase class I)
MDLVRDVLALAREHLDMDVAFVSEWTQGRQVLRTLQGDSESFGLHENDSMPLEGSFCLRVMSGAIANVVHDARRESAVRDLEITRQGRIGAYLAVPLVLSDNRQYGMLCCLSHSPDLALGDRDVRFMTLLARLIVEDLERGRLSTAEHALRTHRVEDVLERERLTIVLQPIVDIASERTVGYEALSRFSDAGPARGPDVWFAEARTVGLGVQLELAAVRLALKELSHLPDSAYLSINLSPESVARDELQTMLSGEVGDRVVLEMTEHDEVLDYARLNRVLMPYRMRGARIAVDDAGAGFASLRHILNVAPDVIKIDIGWVRGVASDQARRSLVVALAGFAREIGSTVVAEGVETEEEARALLGLGVSCAQGYFFAAPRRRADLPGGLFDHA